MSGYPILVKRLAGARAMTIICQACETEAVLTPDELLNEGLYECPANTERARTAVAPSKRCPGSAIMKYDEGDLCRGCGKLGIWTSESRSPIYGFCSRRCKLQLEYRESLLGRH